MPELPEVETIASDLRPHLLGRLITACDLRFPAIVRYPEPDDFAREVCGRRITAVSRRGKYILIHLSSGTSNEAGLAEKAGRLSAGVRMMAGPDQTLANAVPSAELGPEPPIGAELLVVHLGMSGELRYVRLPPGTREPDHLHAVFALDDGCELRYRDPRRFGRLLFGTEQALLAARRLPRLGPEPVDGAFTATDLYRRLHIRRAPLKALLLDQMVVAGVGNIYADESLHRARLRPDRPANTVSLASARRLRTALEETLREGIANRGSSVNAYRDAWGEEGQQQERLRVYGRAGQPCLSCGRPLSSIRLAGRSTVFCRRCQK